MAGVQRQRRGGCLPGGGYQRPWPILAQRAGRQQPAIAAAPVVKHTNLHITEQAVVLQTVVAHQYLGLGVALQQRAGRLKAAGANEDRHPGFLVDQQGLIASLLGQAW